MKAIFKLMFISIVSFLFLGKVEANSISKISMDIYIDSNGDAHVTETWSANLSEGTEGYRFYSNMGNAYITDYRVNDEKQKYEMLPSWNINSSFEEKAYKAGINDNNGNKELCFGISEYGFNTYTLSYIIKGFVATNDDSDIVYWELVPTDLAKLTDDVYIKIHADEKFSDELDVWGYGNYGGYAYVYDGYIEVSNNSLDDNEYMTVLVKFEKGTFNTDNVIENNFDHYYQMAEEGAEHYVDKTDNQSIFSKIFGFLAFFINAGFWFMIIILIKLGSSKTGTKNLNFGETGNRVKDAEMFRELPCGKDVYRAYWLANNYNLMKKQTDFLGVVLLKWLKQDKIKIESNTVGAIFKKEETTIVFNDATCTLDNELESSLYSYMYEASKDGILESKEFEKWCSSNYSKILKWFDKVIDFENNILEQEGKLVKYEHVTLKVFKSIKYKVDSSMMEEAKKMKGLKDFFKEFENMTDKEAIEVKMWEEYLMYAQIFGVADKVAKQFKKLYPDVIVDYNYDSIIFLHSISNAGMVSASSAKSRAESYSSGGGGFSSGGGGGGSFGGGGGGFR